MSSIYDKINALALTVPTGCTLYAGCPACGRARKLGLTSKPTGIVYQCFAASCGIRGLVPTKGMAVSKSRLNSILKGATEEKQEFSIPDHWIDGFVTPQGLKMAERYGLLNPLGKGVLKTSYDPKLSRQVFYYIDKEGKSVGAFGRALYAGVTPKAYIYPGSVKLPIVLGNHEVAVIVEDLFSAAKCFNIGYTGISISGTIMQIDYLEYLKPFKKLIIALDKDATKKAIKIKKLLDFVHQDVVVLPLQQDLKDMTDDEARHILSAVN